MNTEELKKLALDTRSTREAGITLVICSAILAFFIFIPTLKKPAPIVPPEPALPDAFAGVTLEAQAAIVYDLATHHTLFAKNADVQLPLASLTKLLTVYAALSTLAPATAIEITADAARAEAPHAFAVGQSFTLSDLARLTLTASLNDGAVAIASTAATQRQESASTMLAGAASALHLSQTYAVNGSGLDETAVTSGGYGSASDVALLAGALVELAPEIARATTAPSAEATSAGGTTFTVKNTDPVVDSLPRLLLSKTGFTDLAGGNLALVFDAGLGHPIAVVVLGSTQTARFTDGTALVNATLAHFAGRASL